jgi:hypothetical protein
MTTDPLDVSGFVGAFGNASAVEPTETICLNTNRRKYASQCHRDATEVPEREGVGVADAVSIGIEYRVEDAIVVLVSAAAAADVRQSHVYARLGSLEGLPRPEVITCNLSLQHHGPARVEADKRN